MPSTFSPNLRIELIGNGEQAGNWGSTTNTNLGTLVEDAISGYETVSVTSANQAFTYADGASDQARNAMIELTTTTGAAFAVYAPPSPKLYVIYNASSFTATIYNSTVAGNTTAAGTGVAVPAGRRLFVMTNGTNFALVTAPASSSNVANTLVERDGSGNFAAGTITASLTGNVTGNVTGNAGTVTNGVYTVGDQTIGGNKTFSGNVNVPAGSNTSTVGRAGSFEIGGGAAGAATMSFHRSGFAINMGLDTDNVFRLGGWSAGANRLQIDTSGNLTMAGNVTAFSDRRLKDNIVTIKYALDTVNSMRGVAFTKDGTAGIGVIAQEVQEVLPQVVQENANGILSVAYGNIVGVLIEAIKELDAKVKALEAK
jgi:hypothetical protein